MEYPSNPNAKRRLALPHPVCFFTTGESQSMIMFFTKKDPPSIEYVAFFHATRCIVHRLLCAGWMDGGTVSVKEEEETTPLHKYVIIAKECILRQPTEKERKVRMMQNKIMFWYAK